MPTNVTQKDKTLHEIIAWCEKEADKQNDLYRTTYGDDRVRADAMGEAYYAVACHCREMLGYGGTMPIEVPNQAEDTK
jgi:hypothetical protein